MSIRTPRPPREAAKTLAAQRTDLDPIRWIVFTLLIAAASALAGCRGVDETAPEDASAPRVADVGTTPETPGMADGGQGTDGVDSMPLLEEGSVSPERKATLSAWYLTQVAADGDIGDAQGLRDMMSSDPSNQVGGAAMPSNSLGPGPTTELDELGIPTVTVYDPMALRAATGLFAAQVGHSEPDMQNIGIHVISTWELARLRKVEQMPMAARGGQGDIWIIVFDTSEPLTAGGFLPENADELEGLTAETPLAGPDGITTIYYILTLSSDRRGGQFLAVGKGVLNEETTWSRADLEAIDTD